MFARDLKGPLHPVLHSTHKLQSSWC